MAPDPKRLELQTLLSGLEGVEEAYFQPKPNVNLQYPCIVYKLDYVNTEFAGNLPYNRRKRYLVTVIDRNPDTSIPDLVGELPLCSFERSMVVADLNHYIFNLYF